MPHRHKTLPDNFKAVSKSYGQVYNVTLMQYDTYLVSWTMGGEGRGGGEGSTYYTGTVLKEIIYKDKVWEIMEDTVKKELPGIFKFTCPSDDSIYSAKLTGDDYKVTWQSERGALHTWYTRQSFTDAFNLKGWRIVEYTLTGTGEALQTNITLEGVKKFCKDFPTVDVTISDQGYHVVYGDCDTAFAESDEQLQQVMGAISVLESMKR